MVPYNNNNASAAVGEVAKIQDPKSCLKMLSVLGL